MIVLFFIVLPLATILISIVLQRLLKSPILVAILVFAIFLILAFTVFSVEFLINTIVYTILALLTAWIVKTICCILRRLGCHSSICNNDDCCCWEREREHDNDDHGSCGCGCGNNQNENNLEESIEGLQDSIDTLEDNISNLNHLLSRLIGNNNGCGCNRSLRR